MLHIFSRGDLDTGKAKFYACDGHADFDELPYDVPENSTCLVLTTGEIYQMVKGKWEFKFPLAGGCGCYIPVKGVDYFTEKEIKEIIEEAAKAVYNSLNPETLVTRAEFESAILSLRIELGLHQQESTVWGTIPS